jgi:queuine tRNA-ribosyltransferase
MFEFKIIKKQKSSSARTGKFITPHGTINTPVFMPVGTRGTVKTLSPEELKIIGAEIILANTYHLMLRPGEKTVKNLGGLHKWMNWDRPILTDSGGFQVFSLDQGKGLKLKNSSKSQKSTSETIQPEYKTKGTSKVKIRENGVEFYSHLDGSSHFITPEKATKIQHDLGADIIMAFDECAEANSTKEYFEKAMIRTHNWLVICKKEHEKLEKQKIQQKQENNSQTKSTKKIALKIGNQTTVQSPNLYNKPKTHNNHNSSPQALFGIVQGGTHTDLRKKSAEFVANLDLPGNAIGGLAIGEGRKTMLKMVDATVKHLPENKPRYLMGVGTPVDLLEAVDRGIDMFDCVLPTRLARHAAFFTSKGLIHIKNQKFKSDPNPLEKNCKCYSCQNFSRSYIHHLMKENEIFGHRLMTIHNLHFLLNLMSEIRTHINKGTFHSFKRTFLSKWNKGTKTKNTKV